jgi:uncharacterized protein
LSLGVTNRNSRSRKYGHTDTHHLAPGSRTIADGVSSGCASLGGKSDEVAGPEKVVYHLNSGLAQASNGLRHVRNHLEVNPKAKIIVVAHARGVDFSLKDKKNANGNPYEVIVQDLKNHGMQFDVCLNILRNRKLDRKQLIEEVSFVPSGDAEIARL